jgi:hypothetical protein
MTYCGPLDHGTYSEGPQSGTKLSGNLDAQIPMVQVQVKVQYLHTHVRHVSSVLAVVLFKVKHFSPFLSGVGLVQYRRYRANGP